MLFGTNSKRVFIAKNCARTAGITTANLSYTLGKGEIIITDEKGAILNTAALAKAAKAIILHQGIEGGKAIHSDIIYRNQVTKYLGSKFVQQLEKKVHVGWNGTSGAIEAINANEYLITIEHKGTSKAQMAHPFINGTVYNSKITGTTQYDVAKNIADILVLNYSQFEPAMRINVVGDSTSANGVTGGEVMRGYKTVSYSAISVTAPVVGDKLSVPGLATANYEAELASIYEVVAIDTVNKVITLDREYQNENQTGLAITIISACTNYGIELKGILQNFRLGYGDLVKVDWDTLLKNFGTSIVTVSEGTYPNGRHEQAAMDENLFQGYAGRFQDNEYQYQNPITTFETSHAYSSINVTFESYERTNTLEKNGQPKSMIVYLDRSTYADVLADAAGTTFGTNILTGTGADTVNADSVINVLNAFMVGAGVIATGLNTVANGGASLSAGTIFSTGVEL